ncbi:MAG TPA: MBL fold metallo-hydrolase [Patescibacteria group bacterium]|nr:MBL fold metallo-hydrolase [Patescibacteria group bacterium]
MNNKTFGIIVVVILIVLGAYFLFARGTEDENESENNTQVRGSQVQVHPIFHAAMRLSWAGQDIYTDPVGTAALSGMPEPDLILITDVHGDHLNVDTVKAFSKADTVLVVPQVVADALPQDLAGTVVVLRNGETTNQKGFVITGVPMYNVPESQAAPHVKGRGNGYVLEAEGKRVYIAGDTGNTEEIRALQSIDIAFIPMNLPFTMSVDDAAQAVLAFKPKQVFPYHYRGQDGLSDVNRFKQLVNEKDSTIDVQLRNWYPQ